MLRAWHLHQARWISGSLKVTTPGHVFLLWKSSDAICAELSGPAKYVGAESNLGGTSTLAPDAAHVKGSGQPSYIVLRRWVNLLPSMIFKCIVADGVLLAVSQKDVTTAYKHLRDRRNAIKVSA